MSYKEQVDINRIPSHIAIIMDGNGRWAKRQGKARGFGHQEGVSAVNRVTEACVRLGVKTLTLYTFSTENWNRPPAEVTTIMNLLLDSLEETIFMKNNVRFEMIGDRSRLSKEVLDKIQDVESRTANNTAMTMVVAISYSARWEITEAAKKLAMEVKENLLSVEDITEAVIAQHLTTAGKPDPDLLIRTGGELRISNYLLWQCAYSEFYFCDTYWPDYNEEELCKAIVDFQSRERRFGKTGEQISNNEKHHAEQG